MRYFCLLLIVGIGAVSSSRPLAAAPPNFVIILADDLGYSDLGCYGSEIETPHLDRLAAGGLQFTQFYNTGRCWPTRAALMTGYYAQQVGRDVLPGRPVLRNGNRPTWAPLLPDLLAPLGYKSYHSGKWHIDSSPIASGFARSYQLEDHDRYFYPQRVLVDDQPAPPVAKDAEYYSTTEIANRAIEHLEQHAQTAGDAPFLSFVAFLAPHFPLQAPQETIAKYRDTYRAGWNAIRRQRYERQRGRGLVNCELSPPEVEVGPPYSFPKAIEELGPGEVNRPLPWDELSPQQQEFQANKMAIHAAMIDHIDQQVGRIVEQLKQMNAYENTVIMFLSDNGASAEIMIRGDGHNPDAAPGSGESYLCLGPGWSNCSNTPFRRHKTWVHEGGTATPFIVHWPAGIRDAGELRHTVGHAIDVAPTLLELAGAKVEPGENAAPPMPGASFAPQLAADVPADPRTLWWCHDGHRALRIGDTKIVSAKGEGPFRLYDLQNDRSELRDLSSQRSDELDEMANNWQAKTKAFREKLLASPRIGDQPAE
jgi:arylsulfatase